MAKNKFYIYAPSGVITGGQELLHQLCDSLNNKGQEAYIKYYPNSKCQIPEPYRIYNIKITEHVEDLPDNFLILHESQFDRGLKYKNLKLIHWWLSVDNFFKGSLRYLSLFDYYQLWRGLFLKAILVKLYYIAFRRKRIIDLNIKMNYLKKPKIINYAQSFYAIDFLKRNGFQTYYPLSDYINYTFDNNNISKREDLILYNPKKGIKFTQKLINQFPYYKWIPIVNLSYKEVCDLMNRAKIYIDFGNHPGKDRLPREAILSGLCIITGKRGSAFFYEDIPISERYKFDENSFDETRFKNLIDNIFENFENEIINFSHYRKIIMQSKEKFESEVDVFLKNNLNNT